MGCALGDCHVGNPACFPEAAVLHLWQPACLASVKLPLSIKHPYIATLLTVIQPHMHLCCCYAGLPNCSGGAVVLHNGQLAGLHVSITYHLDNSKRSSGSSGGSVYNSGSGGGGSGGGSDNSMLSIERDPAHLSMLPSSEEEDAPDIETSAQVAYDNIGHK